jgi:hypothetical protein
MGTLAGHHRGPRPGHTRGLSHGHGQERCCSAAHLAALQPPSLRVTAAALPHVTGSPGPGVLRRLRPARPVQRSARLSRTAGWMPARREPAPGGSRVHCHPFSGLGARLYPGGLATPTPQAFNVASRTAILKPSRKFPPPVETAGRTAPGPYPPDLSRCQSRGRNNAGSSRTPFRHARRTRPIWQYWTRPGFVRAAPALSGTTRIRLPSATAACCDRPQAKVSHLHSDTQRLTAQPQVLTITRPRTGRRSDSLPLRGSCRFVCSRPTTSRAVSAADGTGRPAGPVPGQLTMIILLVPKSFENQSGRLDLNRRPLDPQNGGSGVIPAQSVFSVSAAREY